MEEVNALHSARADFAIPGTFVHSTEDVQVVLNAAGDVITVIPK